MKIRIFVAVTVLCVCALLVVGQSRKRSTPSPSPVETYSWESFEGDVAKGPVSRRPRLKRSGKGARRLLICRR